MDAYDYNDQVPSWPATCVSTTLLIFHGIILAAIVIVTLFIQAAG